MQTQNPIRKALRICEKCFSRYFSLCLLIKLHIHTNKSRCSNFRAFLVLALLCISTPSSRENRTHQDKNAHTQHMRKSQASHLEYNSVRFLPICWRCCSLPLSVYMPLENVLFYLSVGGSGAVAAAIRSTYVCVYMYLAFYFLFCSAFNCFNCLWMYWNTVIVESTLTDFIWAWHKYGNCFGFFFSCLIVVVVVTAF